MTAADADLTDGAPTPGIAEWESTLHGLTSTWFDVTDTDNGTFTIARISVTPCWDEWASWLSGEVYGSCNPGQAFPFWVLGPPPCPGDLDGDWDVGLEDLGILLASYGIDDAGDLNCDGHTDLADLGDPLANYGCDNSE